MFYKGEFRKLPSDKNPALDIRHQNISPLILIRGDGECLYANQPEQKDELVKIYDEAADMLLYAWTGKYKTDVFQVTAEDLKIHYVWPLLEKTLN